MSKKKPKPDLLEPDGHRTEKALKLLLATPPRPNRPPKKKQKRPGQ